MVQYNRTPTESSGVTSVTAAMSCESYNSSFGGKPCNVKTEMIGEEEGRPSSCKRPKFQQWSTGSNAIHSEAAYFNPLDEPSPLGLTLRKTPSLLDLIQMKLSQEDPAFLLNTNSLNQDTGKRKDARSTSAQASADKLKASNFPVSILRIGTWECISRYEGDLVAKCYFAKHKLVWEVLDGGLKSKIEIQWSDITALRANCPEIEPGTLDIEVSRPPLFFKETNPQPRKHTLWQATSDFTGGQATMCRRHFLQCPQGLLNRHYEKLVQCDPRLNMLSKKPFLSSDSPYFDSRSTVFQEHNERTCFGNVHDNKPHVLPHVDHLRNEYLTTFTRFPDASPSVSQMLVPKCEPLDPEVRTGDATRQETTSPSSVMDSRAIEDHGSSDNDELNMKGSKPREQLRSSESLNELLGHGSGLALSASMSNLVNHICFQQEQRLSGSSFSMGEDTWASNKNVLDEIAQHLLSDSLLSATSDEQAIIARVNSMCSLLEKDVSTEHALEITHGKGEEPVIGYNLGRSTSGGDVEAGDDIDDEKPAFSRTDDLISPLLVENCSVESKCSTLISRKESCGDLLLNLPRIASLPQFFVHGSDELSTRNESNGTAGGIRLR